MAEVADMGPSQLIGRTHGKLRCVAHDGSCPTCTSINTYLWLQTVVRPTVFPCNAIRSLHEKAVLTVYGVKHDYLPLTC